MLMTVPEIPGLEPLVGPDIGEDEEPGGHLHAELIGVFVGIEYRAGNGAVSRRRISIVGVTGRCLKAWCHERDARRTFRVDRIIAFIDLDGVMYEPAEFYARLCGGARDVSAPHQWHCKPGDCLRRPWKREIAVLAALSHSDGFMHPAEIETIVQFVGQCAEIEGVPYGDADLVALAETIRRLKISEAEAVEHLEVIARDRARPHRKGRLLRAIAKVANADGMLHEAEFRFAQMAERRLA